MLKRANNITDAEIRECFTQVRAAHSQLERLIAGETRVGGHPSFFVHIMEHAQIERIAGMRGYREDPVKVYLAMQKNIGVDSIDQWLVENPLQMSEAGYDEHTPYGATTGADVIVCDGMEIRTPEDTIEHMEKIVFPRFQDEIDNFDIESTIRRLGQHEYDIQRRLTSSILKMAHGIIRFPIMSYHLYGYANYFMAYALYPDVMQRDFNLQAEVCRLHNEACAEAWSRYYLPEYCRLDHDMTDSRGTLVDIKSMEKIYFPALARSLEPILEKTNIRMVWHCDGNVMPMLPHLIDIGIRGFQGFQYEDVDDITNIVKLKDKDGNPLFFVLGSSVTRTLPFGKPADVRNELKNLVACSMSNDCPLVLGLTSSMTPGVPWENVDTLIEGLKYYQTHEQ